MTIAIGETVQPCAEKGVGIVDVPMVSLTEDAIKKYGHIVTNFERAEVQIVTWPAQGHRPIDSGTGRDGGITEGDFEIYRQGDAMYAENHAVGGHYVTGWFTDPREEASQQDVLNVSTIYTREANYHPDGGQVFFSRDQQPFVLLLALPGDDITPQDFTDFYCDGALGVHINAGIWHQPPYAFNERMVFNDKQGKVHACVSFDSVKEFGVYMRVSLQKSI